MKHSNCDYFIFIEGTTPEIAGLQPTLDFLNRKLSSEVKQVIRDSNIHLFYSVSPGCIAKIRMNDSEVLKRLIVIDKTLTYDLLKFDFTEIGAEILHEVGHYLNKPLPENKNEVEFYADDFARKCGFGLQLKSGFVKYLKVIETFTDASQNRYFFKNADKQKQIVESIRSRIERIINDEPFLNGLTDTD